MMPLQGLLVIDFSQFLSGPSASLRMADLGARVIKIERPDTGDICRHLYTSNVVMNGESSVFHAINRNKESFAADLKNETDRESVRRLLRQADVVMHNFRPGVMERLGFSYEEVSKLNPKVVYGEISGYGTKGPWKDRPGQDLLVQSLSGLTWLSGNKHSGPVAMGLSIVDMLAGAHLAQGILACLVRTSLTGEGGLVEVSMLESAADLQFEVLTTFHNDGGMLPERTETNNAHAYLGAPYGIYQTKNGYLALAMGSIPVLGNLLGCVELTAFQKPVFSQRDEIKAVLARHLRTDTTEKWLSVLEPADVWCADVLTWEKLMQHEGFQALNMIQQVEMVDGFTYQTTRCPIRIDGALLTSRKASPKLGQDNDNLYRELIQEKEV